MNINKKKIYNCTKKYLYTVIDKLMEKMVSVN